MTPSGVLVVGGGLIYVTPDGEQTIHGRVAAYLSELRDLAGSAVFAARYVRVDHDGAATPAPHAVRLEPLSEAADSARRSLLASVSTARKLRRLAGEAGGAVHFFPDAGGLPGAVVLAGAAIPLVTYLKSDWSAWSRQQHPGWGGRLRQLWWEVALRYELARTDAVVTRDAATVTRHRADGPPTELAMPLLSVRPSDRFASRDPDRDRVLFVGTLRLEKGLGDLAAAVAIARTRRPRIHVRVLGSVPTPSTDLSLPPRWLADELERLGVTDAFEFLGYVDDPDTLALELFGADLLALPSWSEGFPRVVDEAQSFGLPVLATSVGGLKTQLAEDEALLVPPRRPELFADAMVDVLTDDARWRTLAKAGRRSFERRVRETAAAQHLRLLTSTTRR